ncbi:MAG: hypothetical protein RLZZ15_3527 [Verrucomicrobiota bacterium]|jgi:hypothetical protein
MRSQPRSLLAAIFGWLAASTAVDAQTVPATAATTPAPSSSSDTIILSPFEVAAGAEAQPYGTYNTMRIAEPQTWLLTNSFEF